MTAPLDGAILAVETSVRPTSIAALRESETVCTQRILSDDRSHASDLVPAIRDLLAELAIDAAELGVVAVGTGPGSYTGLRVGAATALGLRLGTRANLIGVPSFDAIAWDGLRVGETGAVLRNAFGGLLYAARYRREAAELVAVDAPWCGRPQEIAARVESEPVWLADEAAVKALGGAARSEVRAVEPRAQAILELALRRYRSNGDGGEESVRPLYLRAFGE